MAISLENHKFDRNPDRIHLVGIVSCVFLNWLAIATPAFSVASIVHPFLDTEDSVPIAEDRSYSQVRVEFILREQVEVSRDRIFLVDVAACSASNTFCAEASSIDLGIAPDAGKSIRLTKTSIVESLKHEWPNAEIMVSGPEIIKILASSADVDRAQIQRELSLALEKLNYSNEGVRLKIERMQVISPAKVRPGSARYYFSELVEMPEGLFSRVMRKNGGSVALDVSLFSDDESSPPQHISISAQFLVERLIVIAANDINLGKILSASDLKLDWVVFRSQGQRGFSSIEPLIGQRAKRSVFTQNPIDGFTVEVPALVSRGEVVGMKIRTGDLEISAKVEALGTGANGDVIDVLNKDTKKRLRAKIIAKNQVEAI